MSRMIRSAALFLLFVPFPAGAAGRINLAVDILASRLGERALLWLRATGVTPDEVTSKVTTATCSEAWPPRMVRGTVGVAVAAKISLRFCALVTSTSSDPSAASFTA